MAHVLHSKFCLHLPFYRMIQELERMGLSGLDEATVCNWHKAVADALRPIWKAMHSELLDAEVLHVDETPFRCLRSGKKNGYMWAMSCADSGMNLYYWKDGRSGDVLDALLSEDMKPEGTPYGGTIVSDGYDAYESWIKKLEKKRTQANTAELLGTCSSQVCGNRQMRQCPRVEPRQGETNSTALCAGTAVTQNRCTSGKNSRRKKRKVPPIGRGILRRTGAQGKR